MSRPGRSAGALLLTRRLRRTGRLRKTLQYSLAALLLVAVTSWSPVAQAQHPFYESLAREGQVALERQDWATAAEVLRVAAFGLLDAPPALARSLTALAVAQAGLDDQDGFTETLTRLVDLEERFGAYAAADLTPTLRSRFEAAARERGPEVLLAAVPAFRSILASRQAQATDGSSPKMTRRERRAARRAAEQAAEHAAEGVENPPAPEVTAVDTPEVTDIQVVEVNASAEPVAEAPVEEAVVETLSGADRQVLDRGRATLATASATTELQSALAEVRGVADRLPEHQEAQILAGEIAYRASRFEEAARFFDRVGPQRPDRPELAFYMAVTWYETGQRERAAEVLEPSLPRLQRTPFVESWIDKIFGGASAQATEG